MSLARRGFNHLSFFGRRDVSNLYTNIISVAIYLPLLAGVMVGGMMLLAKLGDALQSRLGTSKSNVIIGVGVVIILLMIPGSIFLVERVLGPIDLGEQRVIYELHPTTAKGAEARVAGLFMRRTSGKGGASYSWNLKTVRASGETVHTAQLTGGRKGDLSQRQLRGQVIRLSGRGQVVFADLYEGRKLGDGESLLEADPRLQGKAWRALGSKGWEVRAQLQSGEEVSVAPPSPSALGLGIEAISSKSHCAIASHERRRYGGEEDKKLYGLLRTRRARVGRKACDWTYKGAAADLVYHSSAAFGDGDDLLSVIQGGKPVVTIPLKASLGGLFHEQWELWKLELTADGHLQGYLLRKQRSAARVRWRLSDGALVASTLLW